jgi:hypothetical protein
VDGTGAGVPECLSQRIREWLPIGLPEQDGGWRDGDGDRDRGGYNRGGDVYDQSGYGHTGDIGYRTGFQDGISQAREDTNFELISATLPNIGTSHIDLVLLGNRNGQNLFDLMAGLKLKGKFSLERGSSAICFGKLRSIPPSLQRERRILRPETAVCLLVST